ncbi:DUF3445 domain-containing protein [Psychromarinibacter sp. C21-152]|uniref:DUF3445 domain-containing protein n=1 Tax=Psychromarinibacter sediminicola TaxID=3033385 RepID=A0AAE3NTB6_9RHOB|nr:DUF3445 domain-containing protein [Psychromarinibacter sediminicola]MDF0600525.1 DUF3445 domain-containing protein [Psychromarinibacter sediminicola]
MTHLQTAPILQSRLAYAPWHGPQGHRLPGTDRTDPEAWLWEDECFSPQMALRDRLVAARPETVLACQPEAREAAGELLETVLGWLPERPRYGVGDGQVTRPDGVAVPVDRTRPMATLARLVQDDLCLLQKQGDEHVLTAAALCFPAHWSLAEKLGQPLGLIHRRIEPYDETVARRVQRLFDGLRPETVLVRSNCLPDDDFALHQPERKPDGFARPDGAPYVRLERQTLRRLPLTQAVVFAIHTAMVRPDALAPEEQTAMAGHLADKAG